MATPAPLHDLLRETAVDFLGKGAVMGEREKGGEDIVLTLLNKLDPITEILASLEADRRQVAVGHETPNLEIQPVDQIQANFPGNHIALSKLFSPDQYEKQLFRVYARNWALIAAMGMTLPYSSGILGVKDDASSNQNLFVVVGSSESRLTLVGDEMHRASVKSGEFGLYASHQTKKILSEEELNSLNHLMGIVIERFPQARLRGGIIDNTNHAIPLAFMYSQKKGIETCENMGDNPQTGLSIPGLQSLFAATYHGRSQHRLNTYVGFSIPRL